MHIYANITLSYINSNIGLSELVLWLMIILFMSQAMQWDIGHCEKV